MMSKMGSGNSFVDLGIFTRTQGLNLNILSNGVHLLIRQKVLTPKPGTCGHKSFRNPTLLNVLKIMYQIMCHSIHGYYEFVHSYIGTSKTHIPLLCRYYENDVNCKN